MARTGQEGNSHCRPQGKGKQCVQKDKTAGDAHSILQGTGGDGEAGEDALSPPCLLKQNIGSSLVRLARCGKQRCNVRSPSLSELFLWARWDVCNLYIFLFEEECELAQAISRI